MYIFEASFLLFILKLTISSPLAANESYALASSIIGANDHDYLIPNTKPPVKINFSLLSPGVVTPIDASSVYMCVIENIASVCRHSPRSAFFARPKIFHYGRATIKFQGLEPMRQPYFTYYTACVVLRGLTEYMTSNDWWAESYVHVFVEGIIVGTAQVWDPDGEVKVASVETIGTQS